MVVDGRWTLLTLTKNIPYKFTLFTSFIYRNKENLLTEVSDLKHQIKKMEENQGDLSLDFKQTKRALNDTSEQLEASQKETAELKRLLKDVELEKQVAWNSAGDLKEHVKSAEGMFTYSSLSVSGKFLFLSKGNSVELSNADGW